MITLLAKNYCQETSSAPVSSTLLGVMILLLLATQSSYAVAKMPRPEVASGTKEVGCEQQVKLDSLRTATNASNQQPTYQPPRLGAPKTRVGGGTRGGGELPAIELLAPASTGLTMQASPKLYWHLSEPYSGNFEYVVLERDSDQPMPLLRRSITKQLCEGFHALNLDDFEVALRTGVVYQWSVAIVRDAQRRSQDIVAQATIERVGGPAQTDGLSVGQYASQGLWYDAIQALSPVDASGHADLLALLKQVGLEDIFLR